MGTRTHIIHVSQEVSVEDEKLVQLLNGLELVKLLGKSAEMLLTQKVWY